MFESDDWDLDQDFLNDVDEETFKFSSEEDKQESEPKRRKTEISDDPIFSFNDLDWCEKETVSKSITQDNENKASRKNLILGMLNKSASNLNASMNVLNNSKKSFDNATVNLNSDRQLGCESTQLPRKNLVLDILRKKNVQNRIIENNTKNLASHKSELKIESRSKINEQQQHSTLLNDRTKCQTSVNNFQEKNNSINDTSKLSSSKNSRKQLLCDILKKRVKDNAEAKNNTSEFKVPQGQSNKKALVRKFPGPAGLLPDNIENLPPVSYLNSLEEQESTKEADDSNLSAFCSQNTKTMFTEGAWQLMLDDLPDGFLKGHEIATAKQMANTNGYKSMKIELMAGVLEHIDHSHENPRIVLKDFTDSIQGILHRDIPLKYPGLFEPNIVLLLHDVGLLKTSASLVSNKFHILISPSNLLAIYCSTGKIERTEYLKSILGDASDEETEKEEQSSKPSCFKSNIEDSNNVNKPTNSKKNTKNIDKASSSFDMSLTEALGSLNESLNFDSLDDLSFSVSSTEITSTQIQKNFSSSTSKSFKQANKGTTPRVSKKSLDKKNENVQNDGKQRSETLLQSLKKFSPNVAGKKKLSHNSKMDVDRPVSINSHSEKVEQETLNNIFSEEMDVDESDAHTSQEKAESVAEKLHTPRKSKTDSIRPNNVKERNKLSTRAKLLQFKSADALTPPESSAPATSLASNNSNETHEDDKTKSQNSFASTLYGTENDSEDEMLSQLDMDNIF